MRRDQIINMLKEVVKDEKTGVKYWFDVDGFMAAKATLSRVALAKKVEQFDTVINCPTTDALKKQIERLDNHILGYSKDQTKSVNVDLIRYIGLALRGDENAFLKPVSSDSFEKLVKELCGETTYVDRAWDIYQRLNYILYLLTASCFYNFIPGKSDKDGTEYFENLMNQLRRDVDYMFGDNRDVRKKLYELIDEVDYVINTSEVPGGVPESWFRVNPKIHYFDCVFSIIDESPELYFDIREKKLRGAKLGFNYYPSTKEILEREAYMKEKSRKYPNRSEDRLYQDELIEALNIRFNECIEDIKVLDGVREEDFLFC